MLFCIIRVLNMKTNNSSPAGRCAFKIRIHHCRLLFAAILCYGFQPQTLTGQAMGLERLKGDTSFRIPDTLTYAKSQEMDYAFNFYNGDTIKTYLTKGGIYISKGTIFTVGRPFTGITLYNPNTYSYEVKYHMVHEGRANLVRTNPIGVSERLEGMEYQILDMIVFHTRPGRKSSVKVVIYAKSVNSRRIITISDIERAILVGEVWNKFRQP
ncbi:MAG: hypothetical protein RLZZ370_1117 [Bacteroidota bacterium]